MAGTMIRWRRNITRRVPQMDQATLLWGTLFGGIGIGFFIYGKKQKKAVPLICGLALMGFPYVVSGTFAMVGVGALLMVTPFFIRR
jgi:hypothetical protein